MSAMIEAGDGTRAARFELAFATTREEILETQKLRYRVFAQEMGAQIDGGAEGIDHDQFDRYCRHLMVRDTLTGQVIACTRILTDDMAPNAGGFYSAGEFDLSMIDSLPGRVMEIGRTCVDAEYRGGAAIATLWQGIASYITSHGYDYLFGCASIGLEDGGASAHAILGTLREKYMAPERQQVRPFIPLPAADARVTEKPKMPPLLKAYVNLGAKACGEAYWDRDFNCADVFMLLNVSDLNPRYARHFLGKSAPSEQPAVLNA
ncbi:MAG: GNAT family N-acyltransferase [Pseudomonadota bacterium]